MMDPRLDLDLPRGWDCRVELKRNVDCSFNSKVEIRRHGMACCVVIQLNQPTQEEAMQKLAASVRAYLQRQVGSKDSNAT